MLRTAILMSLVFLLSTTAEAQTEIKPVKRGKNATQPSKTVSSDPKRSTVTPTSTSTGEKPVVTEKPSPTETPITPAVIKPESVVTGTSSTPESTVKGEVSQTQGNTPQSNSTPDFSSLIKNSEPIVIEKPNGSVNWTQQYIEARGEAVIDLQKFPNPAQAKAMANRGAVVVAQRNLLEMTGGVKVIGETTVQDMITTSDYIYTRVEGIVKGAEMVGPAREQDGLMIVTLRMPIYGEKSLASTFGEAELEQARKKNGYVNSTPPSVGTSEGEIDGSKPFVFNIKGKVFDPSMFPVVVGKDGKVEYDFSKYYDGKLGKFPEYLQLGKEALSAAGIDKGVEVIELIQNPKGDWQLPEGFKKKVNWEKVGSVASKIGKVLFSFL